MVFVVVAVVVGTAGGIFKPVNFNHLDQTIAFSKL
jgi:hypothetical protein